MSRRRRKPKRAGNQGGQDKPTPLGPDTAPVGSPDDDAVEAAALPAESAEKLVQVTHAQSFELSVGPLPHPQLYGEYEIILPGAADRILKMAENAQGHRHRQQSTRLNTDRSLELRGQWMGFLVVVVALIGGMVLIAFDKTLEGATAAVGAIGGVAGLFLWSRRRKPRRAHEVPVSQDQHHSAE